MSKLKIDPDNIVMFFSPTVLSVAIGGKHFRYYTEDESKEYNKELYELIKKVKEHKNPADIAELEKRLDPEFRHEVNALMLRDRKGRHYLKEMPHIPMPNPIRDMLLTYYKEGLDATPVINMWKNVLDNPSAPAQQDIMEYIERFGVPVTDNGYMVLYKSVRRVTENIERLDYLVAKMFMDMQSKSTGNPEDVFIYNTSELNVEEFWCPELNAMDTEGKYWFSSEDRVKYTFLRKVTQEELDTYQNQWPEEDNYLAYFQLPAEYGKKPEYGVREVAELTCAGNLKQIFKEAVMDQGFDALERTEEEEDPLFEPWHRGDYGMRIRLGKMVTMPREECDPDINNECSYGLHIGSYEYVKHFHSHGSVVLACLVNPANIVALPKYDRSKIRCCAYLPYAIIKTDDQNDWEELENRHWREEFIDFERAELEARIKDLQFEKENGSDLPEAHVEELILNAKNRLQALK